MTKQNPLVPLITIILFISGVLAGIFIVHEMSYQEEVDLQGTQCVLRTGRSTADCLAPSGQQFEANFGVIYEPCGNRSWGWNPNLKPQDLD